MRELFFFGDDFINQFFVGSPSLSLPQIKITERHTYDPDKFDLVLKPEYLDSQIKEVEEEIEQNDRVFKSSMKYFEEKRRSLVEKRDKLLSQRGRKNKR